MNSVALGVLLLAHGADPRPITWDEASANLVKFLVTVTIALAMAYPIIAPSFLKSQHETAPDTSHETNRIPMRGVGWLGVALLVVLSVGWWLLRASVVELNAKPTIDDRGHRHTQEKGGQIAMWGDFHAEVARIESGEVKIYLSDAYARPIASRYFTATIAPIPVAQVNKTLLPPSTGAVMTPTDRRTSIAPTQPTTPPNQPSAHVQNASQAQAMIPALDESHRFARLPRQVKAYRITVDTPGWTVSLKFSFNDDRGRHSLPLWCGTAAQP